MYKRKVAYALLLAACMPVFASGCLQSLVEDMFIALIFD